MNQKNKENTDKYILGIDTSNYTTSVALVGKSAMINSPSEYLIHDKRKLLIVKKGERGLRQSNAFFQHISNLPILLDEIMKDLNGQIVAVAVSSKPRPLEKSYMPVFKAGESIADSISKTMKIPCFKFSHQEGHIEAARPFGYKNFAAFQMSGGTCELLDIKDGSIKIIGGSKDISFGQLIDRIGVYLGKDFPTGKEMDMIASSHVPSNILKKIKTENKWFNLSGMETQATRAIEKGEDVNSLISEIFYKISWTIENIIKEYEHVILVGGVASSKTIRNYFSGKDNIIFPENNLGCDNGVGIAKLGANKLWL